MKNILTILLFFFLPSITEAQITTGYSRGWQNGTYITDTSVEKTNGYIIIYTTLNDSLISVSKKAIRVNYYQNGSKTSYGSLPPDPDGSIPAVSVIRNEPIHNLLSSEIWVNGILFKNGNYKFVANSEITK